MSHDERRQSKRAPLTLKIRVDGPQGRHSLTARDVSKEGVFIESAKTFNVGARLDCRLELPGKGSDRGPRLEFTAEVRHQSSKYTTDDGGGPFRGFGVRITRIGSDEQRLLFAFLDSL